MSNSKRAFLTAAALAAAVYFFVIYHPDSGPGVGGMAPDFSLADKTGKTISLSSYRGKWVLVHFWATWCSTCTQEMPVFNKMVTHFKDNPNLVILGLSLDDSGRGNGWKAVENFERNIPIVFTVLMDSRGAAADQFGTYALPETYLIGRDGRILRKFVGEQDWMSSKILKYLENPE
jgi:peroxiredoxin